MVPPPIPEKLSPHSTQHIRGIQASQPVMQTPLTKLFKINHPIILAGMNQAAGPELAAAVTNAGGLGVVGVSKGVGWTPKFLKEQIAELKANLRDPSAPFGVDLLLPQVGGNARKTNKDYTGGKLNELIDIIIAEKAALFVSAVGVPPKEVVDRLHAAKIPSMNVVGHPKHVKKALASGADLICCQGGEAGGHTGNVPFSILIPKVVDLCRIHRSPLTGEPIIVVAAGGIFDGRGLASSLVHGASGVWVGTRFVCAEEAGAPKPHQQAIINAGHDDIQKTIIFTGRPLHLVSTPFVRAWEARPEKIKELTSKGIIPVEWDLEQGDDDDNTKMKGALAHYFAGHAAACVDKIMPAKDIVDEMMTDAVKALKNGTSHVLGGDSKL